MVPVGGAILATLNSNDALVDAVSKLYPGICPATPAAVAARDDRRREGKEGGDGEREGGEEGESVGKGGREGGKEEFFARRSAIVFGTRADMRACAGACLVRAWVCMMDWAGRASCSAVQDLFITLLSMGEEGYLGLLRGLARLLWHECASALVTNP
jgi:hypothetical protein